MALLFDTFSSTVNSEITLEVGTKVTLVFHTLLLASLNSGDLAHSIFRRVAWFAFPTVLIKLSFNAVWVFIWYTAVIFWVFTKGFPGWGRVDTNITSKVTFVMPRVHKAKRFPPVGFYTNSFVRIQ